MNEWKEAEYHKPKEGRYVEVWYGNEDLPSYALCVFFDKKFYITISEKKLIPDIDTDSVLAWRYLDKPEWLK